MLRQFLKKIRGSSMNFNFTGSETPLIFMVGAYISTTLTLIGYALGAYFLWRLIKLADKIEALLDIKIKKGN